MPALASSRPFTACLRSQASASARLVQAKAPRSVQPQRWGQARQAAARRLCRATAEKEGTQQQQEGQPQVPDTPPTPTGATQQQAEQPAAASSQVETTTMSVEEIQQRAALLRQQKAAAAETQKDGLVEGVMEEVGLIKWPSPGKAALNTVLVIAIVAGTAAMLLAVNTVLTELSTVVY